MKRVEEVMQRSDDLQGRRGGHHGAGNGAGVGRCGPSISYRVALGVGGLRPCGPSGGVLHVN